MSVSQEHVSQTVMSIWTTVLNLNAQATSSDVPPIRDDNSRTACVQITGAWSGAVILDCPCTLAQRAAAVFYGTDAERTTREEERDTLGELANMIGGNLKPLLPEPCYLSLPAVADGSEYRLSVLSSRVVAQQAFDCDKMAFVVTILEKTERTAHGA